MKIDLIHLLKHQQGGHIHHHQKTQILEIVHTMTWYGEL